MDSHELAWAAGFFDGEGTVGCGHMQPDKRPHLHLSVSQADVRPLKRFQLAIGGFGRIRGPFYPNRALGHLGRKPMFQLQIGSFETIQATVAFMWRWLSEPKR